MPLSKKRAISPQTVGTKIPRSPSKSIKISSLHSIASTEPTEPIEDEEPEFIEMEEQSTEYEEPVEKKLVTNRSEAPSFSGTLKQIDKTVEYVFAEKKLKQLKTHSSDTYESDPDAESEELEASFEYEKKWGSGDDSNAQVLIICLLFCHS